jgi:hypothetical protein
MDIVGDSGFELVDVSKFFQVEEFGLEHGKEALHGRVVVAIPFA